MQNWQKIFKNAKSYSKITGINYRKMAETIRKLAATMQNWQQIFKTGSNQAKLAANIQNWQQLWQNWQQL